MNSQLNWLIRFTAGKLLAQSNSAALDVLVNLTPNQLESVGHVFVVLVKVKSLFVLVLLVMVPSSGPAISECCNTI